MGYCQVGALPLVCLLLQRRAFGDNGNQQCGSGSQSQRSANETDLGELCRQMQRRCKRFDTPSRCSKPQLALSCISSTANNKVSKTASRQGLFWNLFLEPEVRFCVFTLYVAFDCVWQVILVKGGGERNEVTKLKRNLNGQYEQLFYFVNDGKQQQQQPTWCTMQEHLSALVYSDSCLCSVMVPSVP
ncbi:hypothetical protein T4E_7883 [Trichinella pseudospiralis]|uniref:Secreted protein n=1 Tax=Trichinella pseudospiralis TaxID=6337 RepID=A0A0V0XKY8_TRIPS|nr:hypothetical protein T4E_10677 [Trichinella pseudospiralis]KRX88650.1 hypothetical protein T4E_7883 [Trichinella pseudospiralis]